MNLNVCIFKFYFPGFFASPMRYNVSGNQKQTCKGTLLIATRVAVAKTTTATTTTTTTTTYFYYHFRYHYNY